MGLNFGDFSLQCKKFQFVPTAVILGMGNKKQTTFNENLLCALGHYKSEYIENEDGPYNMYTHDQIYVLLWSWLYKCLNWKEIKYT